MSVDADIGYSLRGGSVEVARLFDSSTPPTPSGSAGSANGTMPELLARPPTGPRRVEEGTVRRPLRRDAFWPMISQLSLNYLSLVEEGKESLQELLRLYNFTGSVHSERQIEGISRLSSRRHFARVLSENGISLVRGTRVEIEFDEDQFVGGGTFLFATVLERFLGHYVSMNSFSQLVARTLQRKEVMREWQPRSGEKVLL